MTSNIAYCAENDKVLIPYQYQPQTEDVSDLISHYSTYEAFKEYMDLRIINNTTLINGYIEPVSLVYFRIIMYFLEELETKHGTDGLDNQMVIIAKLHDYIVKNHDIYVYNNVVINLARLNTELKDPFFNDLIKLWLSLEDFFIKLYPEFFLTSEVKKEIARLLAFFNTPVRFQEYSILYVNNHLHIVPITELECNLGLPAAENLNNPFKIIKGSVNTVEVYNEIVENLINNVFRNIRIICDTIENSGWLSDSLIKKKNCL